MTENARSEDTPRRTAAQEAESAVVVAQSWPVVYAWAHGHTILLHELVPELRDALAYFGGR